MSFRIDPMQGLPQTTIGQQEQSAQSATQIEEMSHEFKMNLVATIVIKHQVAFGESLYLRGEGFSVLKNGVANNATWDKGIEMENMGSDLWNATVDMKTTRLAFKLLINDTKWESGENHNFKDMNLLIDLRSAISSSMGIHSHAPHSLIMTSTSSNGTTITGYW